MFKRVNQYNHAKIIRFAGNIIGERGISESELLESMLGSDNEERIEKAENQLLSLFTFKQKRPLYYLEIEIKRGLTNTRSVVWYASMYIEWLVKFYKKDLRKNKFPLGVLLSKLTDNDIPKQLKENLYEYNRLFWATSKHEIGGYPDKEHLFSLQDAVICCLTTANLANQILEKSEWARAYNDGEIII